MKRSRLIKAALAITLTNLATAQEVPDSKTILKALAEAAATPLGSIGDMQRVQLTANLQAYQKDIKSLPPKTSAERWLTLLDDAYRMKDEPDGRGFGNFRGGRPETPVVEVLNALPPPEHWTALSEAIHQRPLASPERIHRENALRLMGSLLANDTARQRQAYADLNARGTMDDRLLNQHEPDVIAILSGAEPRPDDIVKRFERMLEQGQRGHGALVVPDLVPLVGAARAEDLLFQALTITSDAIVSFSKGAATRELAGRIALRNIDRLVKPPWDLVDKPITIELYEALDKRFPLPPQRASQFANGPGGYDPASFDNHERQPAMLRYVAALLPEGRIQDAAKVLRETLSVDRGIYQYELRRVVVDPAHRQKGLEALETIIANNPPDTAWQIYFDWAQQLGRTGVAIERINAALANADLSDKQREQLQRLLVQGQLATNQVDAAIRLVRRIGQADQNQDNTLYSAGKLVALSLALERPDLAAEAAALAKTAADRAPSVEDLWSHSVERQDLARALVEAEQTSAAVEFLSNTMQNLLRTAAAQGHGVDYLATQPLVELASVFDRIGRPADVLELFDAAPYWQATDLVSLLSLTDASKRSIGQIAASALAASGRRDDARRVVEATLSEHSSSDPAFELFVKLSGNNDATIAKLDELFASHPFEERPLIWKADVLRAMGKLDLAEAAIRKAISIDPSDGDAPRGDRMRAYSVLAAILDAKGNAGEAQTYRNVMKAIRTAEHADRLHEAGLHSRAIELYQRALTFFENAYCIQSRLAVQLADMGDFAAAEKHWRKAYELMPSSFGRVESHCFGCEGVFQGELAQRIAEEVFARLATEQPNNPQVHYLLGYLRKQQGRFADALKPLQEAVRLDPDYVNAWKLISEIPDEISIPPDVRQTAALNMLRLDSRQYAYPPALSHIRDFRALWRTVEESQAMRRKLPETLYPLAAAKARLEARARESGFFHSSDPREEFQTPAQVILGTPAFLVLQQFLDAY